jgi:hypothetical protein
MKKRQGQILNMVVKHVPKPADDSLAHITHEIFLAVHAESAKQINHDDGHGNQCEHPDILVEKNIIQYGFYQKRGCGSRGGHDQHAQHGQKKPESVVFNQIKEAFVAVFEQGSDHKVSSIMRPSTLKHVQGNVSNAGRGAGPSEPVSDIGKGMADDIQRRRGIYSTVSAIKSGDARS